MPQGHILWRHGLAEEVALHVPDATFQHGLELLLRLHAFHHHLQLQVSCKPHDMAQQRLATGVLWQLTDKQAVALDSTDGQVGQNPQR